MPYKSVVFLQETADKDTNYDLIYLDLSQASDKVARQKIIIEVNVHNIEGKGSNWITASIRGWVFYLSEYTLDLDS